MRFVRNLTVKKHFCFFPPTSRVWLERLKCPAWVSRRCIHLEKWPHTSAPGTFVKDMNVHNIFSLSIIRVFTTVAKLQITSCKRAKVHYSSQGRLVCVARTVPWMASRMTALPLLGRASLRNQRLVESDRIEAEADQRQSNLAGTGREGTEARLGHGELNLFPESVWGKMNKPNNPTGILKVLMFWTNFLDKDVQFYWSISNQRQMKTQTHTPIHLYLYFVRTFREIMPNPAPPCPCPCPYPQKNTS